MSNGHNNSTLAIALGVIFGVIVLIGIASLINISRSRREDDPKVMV